MKYQTKEDECNNALEEVKNAVACDIFNKVYKDGQINMGFHGVTSCVDKAIGQYAESHGNIPERIKKQLAYALEALDYGYTGSLESVYEELASEAIYDSGFSFDIIDSKGAFFVRESLFKTDPARFHEKLKGKYSKAVLLGADYIDDTEGGIIILNKNIKSLDLSGNQKITSLDCRRLLDCEQLKDVNLGPYVKNVEYLKMALDRLPNLRLTYNERLIEYNEEYKNVKEAIHELLEESNSDEDGEDYAARIDSYGINKRQSDEVEKIRNDGRDIEKTFEGLF